ncbi:glycosyltransferase, partial [Escherichia coli]|nr:glycosyltransferase [Escherichia coli]MCE4397738.1 glycosyltransferase [Escherichia coli]MCE4457468.1 glycosyltransferase [Escherichia coli]
MISVCMATYNGGEYVYTQLNSILKQLGRNDELIISDDGSTDNTINIIE